MIDFLIKFAFTHAYKHNWLANVIRALGRRKISERDGD